MGRYKMLMVMGLVVAVLAPPWGGNRLYAQSGDTADTIDNPPPDSTMGERAKKLLERRKARVTEEQRKAAAERAKAEEARAAAGKAAPDKDGKGGTK
ncbi:hypothetical protein [Geobacter pickeringii]|uniref:Uncharacterized protein n=1 Tax=Geobacter pickeringii TaxID=345632 RepID=A0A0B5BDT0_9BACT|nr:hypothetical protein [Geobacter pickeringii]AJE02690.1 hypothetical protein GPICK_04275 [Geobacter pickeringii]